jgi:hypothetical protein
MPDIISQKDELIPLPEGARGRLFDEAKNRNWYDDTTGHRVSRLQWGGNGIYVALAHIVIKLTARMS